MGRPGRKCRLVLEVSVPVEFCTACSGITSSVLAEPTDRAKD
jgi:hypothetical protein